MTKKCLHIVLNDMVKLIKKLYFCGIKILVDVRMDYNYMGYLFVIIWSGSANDKKILSHSFEWRAQIDKSAIFVIFKYLLMFEWTITVWDSCLWSYEWALQRRRKLVHGLLSSDSGRTQKACFCQKIVIFFRYFIVNDTLMIWNFVGYQW